MGGPVWGFAAYGVGGVEGGCRGTGVLGFERVDVWGLDAEGEGGGGGVHACDEHAGDLACYYVVGYAVG